MEINSISKLDVASLSLSPSKDDEEAVCPELTDAESNATTSRERQINTALDDKRSLEKENVFDESNPMHTSIATTGIDELAQAVNSSKKPSGAKVVAPATTFNPIHSPNGNGIIRSRLVKESPRITDLDANNDQKSSSVGPTTRAASASSSANRRFEIEQKKIQRKMEEEAEYTFYPKSISKKKFTSRDFEEDRFLSLYGDAKKRHLEQKTERLKEKLSEELTFSPKLSPRVRSASKSRVPVVERLYNTPMTATKERVVASRSDSSEGLTSTTKSVSEKDLGSSIKSGNGKAATATKPEYTFSPAISKRAKSMERTRASADGSAQLATGERLYMHNLRLREKQERRKAEADRQLLEQCTFTPQFVASPRATSASGTTRKKSMNGSSAPSPAVTSSLELTERMKNFSENKMKRLQAAIQAKEEADLAASTFKPHLIAKQVAGSGQGQQLSVHDRLSQVSEQLKLKLTEIEAAVYADLTFQPQLVAAKRAGSPATAPGVTVHDRLYNLDAERRLKHPDRDGIYVENDIM